MDINLFWFVTLGVFLVFTLLDNSGSVEGAALGMEGKWAIHPSQIELAHQVFTPAEKEVERARRILVAMEEAAREGRGAVALDGRLIDAASIRQAQVMVDKAEQIQKSMAAR